MFVKGFLMMAYFHIYNNWRIYELPWDSTITWIVAAILCDLGYYWVHRAAHGRSIKIRNHFHEKFFLKNIFVLNRIEYSMGCSSGTSQFRRLQFNNCS